MEALIQSISDKKDQAAGLLKELKNSIYTRSLFPDATFPCDRLIVIKNKGTRDFVNYMAVGCHIEDEKGVKYYLTADQYSGFEGNKFTANVKGWMAMDTTGVTYGKG
tara:strand:- start:246 stop:566 length:321 start_codon:yes stop_codon:yes gene_type:complete